MTDSTQPTNDDNKNDDENNDVGMNVVENVSSSKRKRKKKKKKKKKKKRKKKKRKIENDALISSERALRRRLECGERANEMAKRTLKTMKAMVENAERLARGEDTNRVRCEMIRVLDLSSSNSDRSKTTTTSKQKSNTSFPIQFSKLQPVHITIGLNANGNLEPVRFDAERVSSDRNQHPVSISVSVRHNRWTAQCLSCENPNNTKLISTMITLRSLDLVPNLSEVLELDVFAFLPDGRMKQIGVLRVDFCGEKKKKKSEQNEKTLLAFIRLPIFIYRETKDGEVVLPSSCARFLHITSRSSDSIECDLVASSRFELATRYESLRKELRTSGLCVDVNKVCNSNVTALGKVKSVLLEEDRTKVDMAVATMLRSQRPSSL
eukprot:g3581.t1